MPAIKEVFEKGVILENIVFLRMFFVAFAHEIGPIEVYAVDGIASPRGCVRSRSFLWPSKGRSDRRLSFADATRNARGVLARCFASRS